jgi:hypothetical protein
MKKPELVKSNVDGKEYDMEAFFELVKKKGGIESFKNEIKETYIYFTQYVLPKTDEKGRISGEEFNSYRNNIFVIGNLMKGLDRVKVLC